MWPFTLIARWQRKRQRNIDRALLFPAIRAAQKSPEAGSWAIQTHIRHDAAWRYPSEYADEPLELVEEG